MRFETPSAFWGLLSLALLFLFSLWRQAAVKTTVPSLLLWKKIPERNPPIRALRRPRWRIELLLQAVAIAAAVAGLAGPYLEADEPKPRRIAFVFDTSARMRAGGRLERMKSRARELAAGPLARDQVVSYAAVPAPRRLATPDELATVDVHVDVDPLLRAARPGADAVILFSDRPVDGTPAALFGAPRDNVGIVAFSASDEEVFVRIVRHGPPAAVPIEVRGGPGTIQDVIPAGQTVWSRRADFSKAGSVRVELGLTDSFPLDNVAEASRLGDAATTVTLTGGRHPSLARAFGAVPGVVLREGGRAAISVGWDAAPGPADVQVWLHPPQARLPGPLEIATHPLTAELEKRRVELSTAGFGELPPERRAGEPLLTAAGKVAGAVRGREIHLSVEVEEWRKTPSFPIFWANVVDFARKGASRLSVARAGLPFPLPAGASIEQAPPGALWSASPTGELLAFTAGEYVVKTRDGPRPLRVHLLDERESDTAGEERPLDWNPGDSAGRERRRRELGGYAAAIALMCILASWLLQRRSE